MNGREYFHESVVKDIVDILTDLKDFDEVQFINNANARRSFKSITSATKDLILTFPVMVSTDIDPDNAIMIAKAQEKKMASLLHILFTAISVGNNEDVYDYVRKFHGNIGGMSGTLDSYSDALDKLATTFGESYDQTLTIDHAVLDAVLEDLKESNYTLPDNVNESSLESYKIVPGYRTGMNDMIIQEARLFSNYNTQGPTRNGGRTLDNFSNLDRVVNIDFDDNQRGRGRVSYARGELPQFGFNYDTDLDFVRNNTIRRDDGTFEVNTQDGRTLILRDEDEYNEFLKFPAQNSTGYLNNDKNNQIDGSSKNNNRPSIDQEYMDAERILADPNATDAQKKQAQATIDAYKNIQDNRNRNNAALPRDNRPKNVQDLDHAKYMESMTKAHNAVVLNNEYKKANELQPTMMVVNFMKKTEKDGAYINTAVIGIKCKIYPVTSADIVNRLSGKLKDKSFLTNFVRATTNEIGFFRDFLFAVDAAKTDAKSYGKTASSNKLWKVLERRSVKSRFRRSLKMYNDATAISTLVLSENDTEYLKKVHSVDMMDVKNARKILDYYNFMCIVIANQSTEVASFLYDTGDDTYEMIPFAGLEREASDNSYKKMVNLLSKVSR